MLLTRFFVWLVRLLVGAYPRWIGTTPSAAQRIYFANHTSHLDTLVVWASMPRDLRSRTRVIAAQDYWDKTAIRRHIVKDGLNAVLIDRKRQTDADPLDRVTNQRLLGVVGIVGPGADVALEVVIGKASAGALADQAVAHGLAAGGILGQDPVSSLAADRSTGESHVGALAAGETAQSHADARTTVGTVEVEFAELVLVGASGNG